jgi:hypothetical protein
VSGRETYEVERLLCKGVRVVGADESEIRRDFDELAVERGQRGRSRQEEHPSTLVELDRPGETDADGGNGEGGGGGGGRRSVESSFEEGGIIEGRKRDGVECSPAGGRDVEEGRSEGHGDVA